MYLEAKRLTFDSYRSRKDQGPLFLLMHRSDILCLVYMNISRFIAMIVNRTLTP